jgi:spore maturation protein CgeB
MYKTKEELNEKIKYYLENEEERIIEAKKLSELIWSNYTFDKQAKILCEKLKKYINEEI